MEGKGWVDAEDVQFGDEIRKADGTTGIVWLKWNVYKTQEMYNLTVDTAHTFFVGEGQWLVHNCPNPRGMNGNLDHQATVDRLTTMAKDEFGSGADLRYNKSIFNSTGLDRRPDISVYKDDKLLKVFEAARTKNGVFVPREQIKMYEYFEYDISSYFMAVQ